MTHIEIHVVDTDERIDRKDVLELLHANLIKCVHVKRPKINYGLNAEDTRKYISFPLTDELLQDLRNNGIATPIPTLKTDEAANTSTRK